MKFSTDKYGGKYTEKNETLFTVGNGNIGMRGDTEEKSLSVHKGTYINGFFDSETILYGENAYGYAKNHQTILNLPDPKLIELTVDGFPFGLDKKLGCVSNFKMELNEDTGIMTRETDWAPLDKENSESSISVYTERLASFVHPNCAVIKYTVTNTSPNSEEISISSFIDTSVQNILAEFDPRKGAKFRHKPLIIDSSNSDDGKMTFTAHTAKSGLYLAGSVVAKIEGYQWTKCEVCDESPVSIAKITLKPAETLVHYKYICYVCGKSDRDLLKDAVAECQFFASEGFDKACAEQKKYLDDFWDIAGISIEGDAESEEALRFNLFHLLQSAGRSGKVSIAAKGLTSEGYEGHFFWDTESYVCPVFTYVAPEIASKLLEYRGIILDKARERAKIMNLKGALYPWRTIDGEETSAYFPAGTAQYHINADILFALNRFLNAHGNKKIDRKIVEEMFAESSRMYQSLGSYSASGLSKGKFVINDVTGPDEYTAVVNNNAFTNLMVREIFELSQERSGAAATAEEKAAWKHTAENIYIPFDDKEKIYPQDGSFMEKADWDFENTPASNYPLLLHYHPLVIYRHRVLKQPDLVLAQFLLSGRFSLAEKIRNYEFYEKYTTGDSSLSHCIMSIMAAECRQIPKAMNYLKKTVRMDIDDLNGNSNDGIHTACMAGSWMSIVYGFAGFHDYNGRYSFTPRLPAEWKKLEFSMTLKGGVLDICLSHDEAIYTLRRNSLEKISFYHFNKDVSLNPGESKAFRVKPKLEAVLFDLDGVITNTAPLHYRAWKEMADREGLFFNEKINERLLGISREDSLEEILKANAVQWPEEKKKEICAKKNMRYVELLQTLTPDDILPGILSLLEELKRRNIKASLASASKNAGAIVNALGISEYFAAMADPSQVQKSKPAPDIFLDAAEKADVWYDNCIGIEDSQAGIFALNKAGIKAVGINKNNELECTDLQLHSTSELTIETLLRMFD